METLYPWNIEAYVAVQLMCCFNWRAGAMQGFCNRKLAIFESHLTDTEKAKMKPMLERLVNELSDINRTVQEIPLWCTMVPAQYRADAWRNCQKILKDTPFKRDEIFLKGLEKGLCKN